MSGGSREKRNTIKRSFEHTLSPAASKILKMEEQRSTPTNQVSQHFRRVRGIYFKYHGCILEVRLVCYFLSLQCSCRNQLTVSRIVSFPPVSTLLVEGHSMTRRTSPQESNQELLARYVSRVRVSAGRTPFF